MRVVVVGGGKVGFYLVETLREHGHTASIIEADREAAVKIANTLDIQVVHGDGSSLEALEAAGCAQAEVLISVTGNDEDNLVICQLAKKCFDIPRTVARVNNPKNTAVMKRLGVDIPVSTTDSIARILEREAETAAIRQLMSLNRGQASLLEFQLPEEYVQNGITLLELPLPDQSIVASITRGGELIIPRGNTRLMSGDKIIVICKDEVVHEISKILGITNTPNGKGRITK